MNHPDPKRVAIAVSPQHQAARVAARYASSPLIKELEEDYHSLWHDKHEREDGKPRLCPLKAGVPDCEKMTLKEFVAKWKRHGLKAVKVQRLPTTYSYYDCGSHATLRTEQIHGSRLYPQGDITVDLNTPIPWSKAKKGDWVQWPWHHGVVIDPKRKIVESCWGVDGWVFQHPVDLSTYGAKPTVHSVHPKEKTKTASSDGQCIVGGQCFRYAVMWDGKGPGSSPDDIVVHGNVHGLVGPHAWVERKDGRVFDWQTVEGIWETLGRQPDPSYTKRGWPKREFYAEFKPRKMKRYTAEDALINGIRNRHYGPWDADEEYRPPIRSASRVAARYLMASRRQRR